MIFPNFTSTRCFISKCIQRDEYVVHRGENGIQRGENAVHRGEKRNSPRLMRVLPRWMRVLPRWMKVLPRWKGIRQLWVWIARHICVLYIFTYFAFKICIIEGFLRVGLSVLIVYYIIFAIISSILPSTYAYMIDFHYNLRHDMFLLVIFD